MIKAKEITEIHEELTLLIEASDETDLQSLLQLNELINRLFVIVTRDEKIVFHSAFSRIAYAQYKYKLARQDVYHIHQVRRKEQLYQNQGLELDIPKDELQLLTKLGIKAFIEIYTSIFQKPLPPELEMVKRSTYPKSKVRKEMKGFMPSLRVVVHEIDTEKELMTGHAAADPDKTIHIRFNISDRNENFTKAILDFKRHGSFPVAMQLQDVEVDQSDIYRPLAIVIEPDYLIDVTTVAESAKNGDDETVLYLMRRFLPKPSSPALVLGNITNFFLDELMMNNELTFDDLFHQVFQQNPLAFTLFEDDEVRQIFQNSKLHFINLKSAITKSFSEKKIEWEDCYLEPSFYAPEFGIQGRLDVYHENPKEPKNPSIVELKSGKIWRPNRHGLNQSHYVQTLLYDLMLTSSFGRDINPVAYILYSAEQMDQLKYAPKAKTTQYEALNTRNKIISLERALRDVRQAHHLFSKISPDNFPKVKGFVKRDIEAFYQLYSRLSRLERAYFLLFTRFITIEHSIAKIGVQQFNNINGQAALWLDNYHKKDSEFNVLGYLKIIDNQTKADDPVIVLKRTEKTNVLANFRVGDIGILYPFLGVDESPIQNQVFKCSIVELDQDQVTIRLRSKQLNFKVFERFEHWNLEHDLIDSSFLGLYRNLSTFLKSTRRKKDLLLGIEAPSESEALTSYVAKALRTPIEPRTPALTDEQIKVLNKAIAARDYFLIWGPPGTGKTSIMVRQLTEHYLRNTTVNILLLAYTNRAVDEICAAVEGIDNNVDYIRIGSRYATNPKYRNRLFNNQIRGTKKRSEVRKILDDHRIFTATISSFSSKDEILKLKKFDIVIVDEASQVIEPQIVGLLARFQKFILIGDHNQLPAVVQQEVEMSFTDAEIMNEIGISNLRNSLFERLYKNAQKNNWYWAYDILRHQGRMHQELMEFPNQRFYKGKLNLLPESIPYRKEQEKAVFVDYEGDDHLLSQLASQRKLFFETPIDNTNTNAKTNIYEAQKVVELIKAIKQLHGPDYDLNKVGIITPYRGQISAIRRALHEGGIDPYTLSIDTVERYQGSARDIIILSLSQNSKRQVYSLSTLSEEGVDRKLNVALTRARQQIILVGNTQVLSSVEVYGDLVRWMRGRFLCN